MVTAPVYLHGFIYHDFEIRSGRETISVSWTSGTGDLGPVVFSLGGREYVLELGISVVSDRVLAQDELVLWPTALYRAASI